MIALGPLRPEFRKEFDPDLVPSFELTPRRRM